MKKWLALLVGLLVSPLAQAQGQFFPSSGGAPNATAIIDDAGCTANQAYRRNAGDTAWVCFTPSAGASNPAGTGSELQYRFDGTTFAALANSSVSGSTITVGSGGGGITVASGGTIQATGTGKNIA